MYNKLKTNSKGKEKKISKTIGKDKTSEIDRLRRLEKKIGKGKVFFKKIFFYLLKEKTRGDK